MKIPDKVIIDGMEYKIIQTDEVLLSDHIESRGVIDFLMHKILLNKTCQDRQGMEKTLLHEIIHGIIYEREFELDNEENTVEGISKGLYQVIMDNPEIFS